MSDEFIKGLLDKYLAAGKIEYQKEYGDDNADDLYLGDKQADPTDGNVDERCVVENCKRKGKFECVHKMCFQCCCLQKEQSDNKDQCPGHYAAVLKKEEEDRLIAEGLEALSKPKTKFYHFEEKFMNHGQTIVIWCLSDFLNNPSFCEDTFAQYKTKGRRELLMQKLRGGADSWEEFPSSTADEQSASSSNRELSGRKRSAVASRESSPAKASRNSVNKEISTKEEKKSSGTSSGGRRVKATPVRNSGDKIVNDELLSEGEQLETKSTKTTARKSNKTSNSKEAAAKPVTKSVDSIVPEVASPVTSPTASGRPQRVNTNKYNRETGAAASESDVYEYAPTSPSLSKRKKAIPTTTTATTAQAAAVSVVNVSDAASDTAVPKKRGRPSAANKAQKEIDHSIDHTWDDEIKIPSSPRKKVSHVVSAASIVTNTSTSSTAASVDTTSSVLEDSATEETTTAGSSVSVLPGKKRGRPAKSASTAQVSSTVSVEDTEEPVAEAGTESPTKRGRPAAKKCAIA